MNFLSSLSRKLGFTGAEEDDRSEELEENELEEEEDEEEDAEAPRFSLRFPFGQAQRSRRQPSADEEEDEPEEEPPRREPQPARAASSRRGNVIHDSRMDTRAQEPQYTHCERIISVRQLEECREIIKYLLHGESILLNLENIDPKDCGRVVDLLSGAAFALQGRMIKVAHLSYLLAPENVEIIESDAYGAGRARYSR